jgi:hypothetical protein
MGDRDAEALRGLLGRVLLEPAGLVARPRHDEHLVRGELAERVLDRLHGIGIAHFLLHARRLGRDRPLGLRGDVSGLLANTR